MRHHSRGGARQGERVWGRVLITVDLCFESPSASLTKGSDKPFLSAAMRLVADLSTTVSLICASGSSISDAILRQQN